MIFRRLLVGLSIIILVSLLLIPGKSFSNGDGKASGDKFILTPTYNDNSHTDVFIPSNLEECFTELNKMLHPTIQMYLKDPSEFNEIDKSEIDEFLSNINLMRILRNYWRLWDDESNLRIYFSSLGVQHPEDITNIVLTSYGRFLQGAPIELEKQVQFFKQFWLSANPPEPFEDKKNGGLVTVKSSEYIREENKVVHYGVNSVTGDKWAYEHDKGWYPVTSEKQEKQGK